MSDKTNSAIYCSHANEMPNEICRCGPKCYCATRSCKQQYRPVKKSPKRMWCLEPHCGKPLFYQTECDSGKCHKHQKQTTFIHPWHDNHNDYTYTELPQKEEKDYRDLISILEKIIPILKTSPDIEARRAGISLRRELILATNSSADIRTCFCGADEEAHTVFSDHSHLSMVEHLAEKEEGETRQLEELDDF